MCFRRKGGVCATVLCALVAGPCLCQDAPWASVPFADPLRFSSLQLEGVQAVAPPRGEWQFADVLSYFNVWQLTWHTGTVHRVMGLLATPLTDAEVKAIEQAFPRDQFYHIDLEGARNDLYVSRGFAGGLAVTVCVPWIDIGTPHWDAIAERFHDDLGLGNMRRDWFPRGQSTVVVRGRHGTIERLSELAGSGIGDMSVSVTGPLGEWLGAEHRWVVAVEAPTGEKETLRGSGGWDAGVRWFGTWGTGPRQVRVALAYTWLDSAGSWLGARRDNTWAALAEGHAPLGRRLTVRASARFDSSPLASFTGSDIGKVSFYWTVGVLAPRAGNSWVAFDLGENYPGTAEAPDFSFHLQVGVRIPGTR
jgi:hypothetical protein